MEEFFGKEMLHSRLPHSYIKYGEAVVGESLECERDPENTFDRYAVAVKMELS